MAVNRSDEVKPKFDDHRILMMEGVNRPVIKQLCVPGVGGGGGVRLPVGLSGSMSSRVILELWPRVADLVMDSERDGEDKGKVEFSVHLL